MMIDCHFELQMGQFHIEPNFQSDASVIGLFGASGSGKRPFYMPLLAWILRVMDSLKYRIKHGLIQIKTLI